MTYTKSVLGYLIAFWPIFFIFATFYSGGMVGKTIRHNVKYHTEFGRSMRIAGLIFFLMNAFLASALANDTQKTSNCGFREYRWKDTVRNRVIKAAVWYPTYEQTMAVAYGPFHGHARTEAAITPGRHPLVLISHGTGGHRYNQFYLAETLAAHGYVVLAVQHPRNCTGDDSDADLLINLWNRPKDISFALDQASKEPGLVDHIHFDRVGVIGHSLGGYTALVLIGAKPDIGNLDEFCNSFRGWFTGTFCDSKADELEAWRKGTFSDFSHLQDTRFRAAFVMAPGVPLLFDKTAMASIRAPVFVFISGKDEILKGREKAYRQYLPPTTTYVELPEAGHYVYLMECSDAIKQRAPEACADIGTSRVDVHPILQKKAVSFFENVLKNPE